MTNPNDPIWVSPDIPKEDWRPRDIELFDKYGKGGLTKREYFAGLALQGIMSNDPEVLMRFGNKEKTTGEWISINAIACADLLILELNK